VQIEFLGEFLPDEQVVRAESFTRKIVLAVRARVVFCFGNGSKNEEKEARQLTPQSQ
jgi:hypothetical protein